MATLMEALPYRRWIVGVGLDSDERDNPPGKFAAVFARAKAEGFFLTMHCDIDQVGSIDNIRAVIDEVGVDRIDHGTNIVEDPALVAIAKERGLGFTTCPVSNSFVTEQMKSDEIVGLLREGVRVTINSDDPAYFGAYVGRQLRRARRAGGSVAHRPRAARDQLVRGVVDHARPARGVRRGGRGVRRRPRRAASRLRPGTERR